jgi:hypothetical protein
LAFADFLVKLNGLGNIFLYDQCDIGTVKDGLISTFSNREESEAMEICVPAMLLPKILYSSSPLCLF